MCQNFVLLMRYNMNVFHFHFIEESNDAIGKKVPVRNDENNLVRLYFSHYQTSRREG